jgi:glyoxalase/bleomycin resistance protein/dioxygenase superfamily protein
MTRLADLWIADAPERWEALGFSVNDGVVALGGVTLRLGADGRGIVAWAIEGVPAGEIDGLTTNLASPPPEPKAHANGAIGLDHVVITTPDFDRTRNALEQAGMPLSRVDGTMGFKRLGPAILELVQASDPAHPEGPARFWGLVVVVGDLEALAQRLGDHLGDIKKAVQPGRRIATLRPSAGLSEAVAFMDPER